MFAEKRPLLPAFEWTYFVRSRQLSIDEQRIQFEETLNENPGLKSQLDDILTKVYRLAVIQALKETKISKNIFPEGCPWALALLIKDGFYPN